ncbi:TioE family transcriptional regulator [Streptomyces mayteni]
MDLARPYGLSGQAVRNYEAAGILPPAERSPSGYRRYTSGHAAALRAFLALVPAHGHASAREIMTLVNAGRTAEALTVVDRGHAELLTDRRTLDAIEQALRELAPAPRGRPATVGALAHQLGLRPATLRRWERCGLLRPARDPATGYRVYAPSDVRDAHLVHQLRRSGYLLPQIAPLLAELRDAPSPTSAAAAIAERRDRLHSRALAMLNAAAELDRYLSAPLETRTANGRSDVAEERDRPM